MHSSCHIHQVVVKVKHTCLSCSVTSYCARRYSKFCNHCCRAPSSTRHSRLQDKSLHTFNKLSDGQMDDTQHYRGLYGSEIVFHLAPSGKSDHDQCQRQLLVRLRMRFYLQIRFPFIGLLKETKIAIRIRCFHHSCLGNFTYVPALRIIKWLGMFAVHFCISKSLRHNTNMKCDGPDYS